MSKFYDEAYKWSLYEKYHNGFTLTELCEISGISDKSLHEWFKRFDYEYAQASVISLSTVRQNNARLKKATMESFFASLKVEEIHRYRYHGISDLAASLKEYLEFYNHKRPHSSIGNQTPVQAEETYFKKQSAVSISTGCVPFVCKK